MDASLAPDEEAHIREVFDLFDKDKTGVITCSELKALLESLGQHLNDVEAMELMATLDQVSIEQ